MYGVYILVLDATTSPYMTHKGFLIENISKTKPAHFHGSEHISKFSEETNPPILNLQSKRDLDDSSASLDYRGRSHPAL